MQDPSEEVQVGEATLTMDAAVGGSFEDVLLSQPTSTMVVVPPPVVSLSVNEPAAQQQQQDDTTMMNVNVNGNVEVVSMEHSPLHQQQTTAVPSMTMEYSQPMPSMEVSSHDDEQPQPQGEGYHHHGVGVGVGSGDDNEILDPDSTISCSQSKFPFIELSSFTTTTVEVIHDQLGAFSTPLFTILTNVTLSAEDADEISHDPKYRDHPLFKKTGLTVSRRLKDFEWLYDSLRTECIGCLIPPKDLLTTNIDRLYEQTCTDPKILKGKYLSIFLTLCARHPILCKSYLFWDFISGTEEELQSTMRVHEERNSNVLHQGGTFNPGEEPHQQEKKKSSGGGGGGGLLFNLKKIKHKTEQHEKEREYIASVSRALKSMLQASQQLKKHQESFLQEFDSIGRAFKVYGNFEANNNCKDMMNITADVNSDVNSGVNSENKSETSSTLHNVFHTMGDVMMSLSTINTQHEPTTQYEQYLLLYTKYLLPNLVKFLDLSKEMHSTLTVHENDLNKQQQNAKTLPEVLQKLRTQYEDMKRRVQLMDDRFPLEWDRFRYELKIDLQYSLLGSLIKRNNDHVEMMNKLKAANEQQDRRKSVLLETYDHILLAHKKLILPTGSTNK